MLSYSGSAVNGHQRDAAPRETIVWLLRKARGAHLEKTTSDIKYSGFQVQNNT